jgi:hypothetical protein
MLREGKANEEVAVSEESKSERSMLRRSPETSTASEKVSRCSEMQRASCFCGFSVQLFTDSS